MSSTSDTDSEHPQSHLFTLRLWREELGGGQTEWRGRLRHVLSGDTRHFREWPTLIELLVAMLENGGPGAISDGDEAG